MYQGNKIPSENLCLAVKWPKGDDGLEELKNWLYSHKDTRLVIIDTLIRFCSGKYSYKKNIYEEDYQKIEKIKYIADEYQVAIIIVHHTNKKEFDDFMDKVSGSTGLTGAADAVAVLNKTMRSQMNAELAITGKDIPDQNLALKIDNDLFIWELLGDAVEYKISQERKEVLDVFKNYDDALTSVEVAEKLDKGRGAVRSLILKLAAEGFLIKIKHGQYIFNKDKLF